MNIIIFMISYDIYIYIYNIYIYYDLISLLNSAGKLIKFLNSEENFSI